MRATTVIVIAVLDLFVLAAIAQATHTPYDITGWVETEISTSATPEWVPAHRVYAAGGGFRLGFNASDTKAVPFEVCLTKGGKALKCWKSSAWPVKRIRADWNSVGHYVVKWYVRGRVRATWPLHVYGENA